MDQVNEPAQAWQGVRTFVVERTKLESETVTSFYLVPEDGGPLVRHQPGQFLGFKLDVPGAPGPVNRDYTISDCFGDGRHYRLSIKREPPPADDPAAPAGLSSNYFHDHVRAGSKLQVRKPAGAFFLQPGDRPVVLLSGGVGLTPMIAMLNHMVETADPRPVWFIHGVRNGAEHAFGGHVRRLAREHANVHAWIVYQEPREDDVEGRDYDASGLITMDMLKDLPPGPDCDFYLCGPPPFMKVFYNALLGWGAEEGRIFYEFFGPATVLKEGAAPAEAAPAAGTPAKETAAAADAGHQVTFRRSGVTVAWDPSKETILDLAEAHGLTPDFSCRSGVCHTCLCTLVSGEIEYVHDDVFEPDGEDEVLICSSRPKTDVVVDI